MIKEIINKHALKNGIDPDLALAIATVESSLNPFVMRYELGYRWTYHITDYAHKLKITDATEEQLQKFSYGLFQLMGGLARTIGYDDHLPKILDPEINASLGCRHIKSLLIKFKGENDAISSFNQGSPRKTDGGLYQNQQYCDKVHKELLNLRRLK